MGNTVCALDVIVLTVGGMLLLPFDQSRGGNRCKGMPFDVSRERNRERKNVICTLWWNMIFPRGWWKERPHWRQSSDGDGGRHARMKCGLPKCAAILFGRSTGCSMYRFTVRPLSWGHFSSMCVCVCALSSHVLWTSGLWRTSRGHTGGRSHRISPPSFCGARLNFYREKN